LIASPRSRAQRWRRGLKWSALSLTFLLALVLGSVVLLVTTDAGTRWVISTALSTYAESIPGGAAVERVEGNIWSGVTLRGVELSDAAGRPLVVCAEIELRLEPWALGGGHVDVRRLVLRGTRVHLPTEGAGFADLAPPPSGDDNEPPSNLLGPDLPLRISGTLVLDDAQVLTGGEVLVRVPSLDVRVDARGQRAEAHLQAALDVPTADLDIPAVTVDLAWAEPVARVDALRVTSNFGTLALDHARLDAATTDLDVVGFDAQMSGAFAERLGLPPGVVPRASAEATAWSTGLSASIGVEAGDAGAAALDLTGRLSPRVDVQLAISAWTDLEPWALAGGGTLRVPSVETTLHLTETADAGWHAWAERTRLHIVSDEHPVELSLDAHATDVGAPDSPAWMASGEAHLGYRATRLDARAFITAQQFAGASLSLHAQLGELEAAARAFVDTPPVSGILDASVACLGRVVEPSGSCAVNLAIDDGDPIRAARLGATVRAPGVERLLVSLHELSAELEPLSARLVGEGATVELSSDRVAVEGLDVALTTSTGTGRIEVGGTLDSAGAGRLSAHVNGLQLAAARPFAPKLGLGGRIDGDVVVSGSLAQPNADVDLHARGLAVSSRDIGDVDATVSFADGALTGHVGIDGHDAGHWTADLGTTAEVSLSPPSFAWTPGRALRFDARARGLRLATLPAPAPVEGSLDLELSARGTVSRPLLTLHSRATKLAYDGKTLGDVDLEASYAAGRGAATVTVDHPRVDTLRVHAEIPVRVRLDAPPRWAADGDHLVALDIAGADLGLADTWAAVPLAGSGDVAATLRGPLTRPEIHVITTLRDVGFRGTPLGGGAIQTDYADDRVTVAAALAGPGFEGLGVTARIPVTIDALNGSLVVHDDEPLEAVASLTGAIVQRLSALTPVQPPIDAAGRVSAIVELGGTPRRPIISFVADGTGLAYGGREVGRAEVEARYAAGRTRAQLDWSREGTSAARVTGDIPVDLALSPGEFTWRPERRHSVNVEVPRIDPALLAPFVELPPELDFTASLYAVARGPIDQLELSAALRGWARPPHLAPVRLRVDLDADAEHQRLVASAGDTSTITVGTAAPIEKLARGTFPRSKIPLEATVAIEDAPLSAVGILLPEHLYDVEGGMSAHATVTETVGAPKIVGNAKVSAGAATVVAMRQRFDRIGITVDFDNERITLSQLQMRSGKGTLSGRGEAKLTEGAARATVHVDLDRIPLQSPGLPRLQVTSALDAQIESDTAGTAVELALKGSRIDVVSSNVEAAKAIPENPRVHQVTRLDAPPSRAPAPDGARPSPDASAPLRIAIDLSDPLRIRGPAVDMTWGGSLSAKAAGGSVSASGALTSGEGFFDLMSNRFSLDRGRITVPDVEDLQLFADIAATSRVGDFDVTATIRGPLPRPELKLTAVPNLTESQVFTLLLTGTADFDDADPDQMEAQAASLLAAFSSPALQRQLNERLRVDRIGIGVGETTNEPILSVGKNLTRRVYAETKYHHNAPARVNRAQLDVRYRFAPRWSLETFVGDAAAAGIDVFWGRSFDTKRRRSTPPKD
jgi:autotransporter translocation and assembly factor TamB